MPSIKRNGMTATEEAKIGALVKRAVSQAGS
jgi:hypothetical protein